MQLCVAHKLHLKNCAISPFLQNERVPLFIHRLIVKLENWSQHQHSHTHQREKLKLLCSIYVISRTQRPVDKDIQMICNTNTSVCESLMYNREPLPQFSWNALTLDGRNVFHHTHTHKKDPHTFFRQQLVYFVPCRHFTLNVNNMLNETHHFRIHEPIFYLV